jgi:hypothetical protein
MYEDYVFSSHHGQHCQAVGYPARGYPWLSSVLPHKFWNNALKYFAPVTIHGHLPFSFSAK